MKKAIKYILTIVLQLFPYFVGAQSLKVEAFGEDFFSAEAQGCHIQDANGNCCALLKVLVLDEGVEFVTKRLVKSETRGKNEFWAWLSPESQEITVKAANYPPVQVKFSDYNSVAKLQSKHAYILKLRVVNPKGKTVAVSFKSNAPDAKLFIDGYDADRASDTYQLLPGEHTLMAEHASYETYMGTIEVLPDVDKQQFDLYLAPIINDPIKQYAYACSCRDKEKKLKWMRSAAEGGCADAMHSLAYNYMGREKSWEAYVKPDTAEAVKWYTRAAEAGAKYGKEELGNIYYEGIGVPVDMEKALFWYLKAVAEEQSPKGLCERIGYIYERGEGVERDYYKALKWYEDAICIEKGGWWEKENGINLHYKRTATALERIARKYEPNGPADEGVELSVQYNPLTGELVMDEVKNGGDNDKDDAVTKEVAIRCWEIIRDASYMITDDGVKIPTENYSRAQSEIDRLKNTRPKNRYGR